MEKPSVLMLMCTYNRHRCLERAVKAFIDQDYQGEHSLLIFNTGKPLILGRPEFFERKKVRLINQTKDSLTGQDYKNVGNKHRDALNTSEDYDVLVHASDDDYFTRSHISEGVKGLLANPQATGYKPLISYFRSSITTVEETVNTMEPSIFLKQSFVRKYGYLPNSVKYHDGWLKPLVEQDQLVTNPLGEPTYVYEWSGTDNVWKLSGAGQDTDENFMRSQAYEKDYGDGIVTPLSSEKMQFYYDIVNK